MQPVRAMSLGPCACMNEGLKWIYASHGPSHFIHLVVGACCTASTEAGLSMASLALLSRCGCGMTCLHGLGLPGEQKGRWSLPQLPVSKTPTAHRQLGGPPRFVGQLPWRCDKNTP